MEDWQDQVHVKWECKYHVVILPKYPRHHSKQNTPLHTSMTADSQMQ